MLRRLLVVLALMAVTTSVNAQGDAPPQMLPNFVFTLSNGSTPYPAMMAPPGKPLIVVYFNPTCEHCQQEATWIAENAADFAGVNFLFVTTESGADAEAFKTRYFGRTTLSVTMLLDKNFRFDSYFGNSPFPSIYIYGADRKLRKYFRNEEVPVDKILEALGR